MKPRYFLIMLWAILLALPAQAAPLGEGGGGEATPTPSAEAITVEVQVAGEAHVYPTANAPNVGRVDPGDTVRVIEQLDDWYRIEVTERAMGRPVMPLANGWVREDVFGAPLDGVPPASRPTATPTATATPSTSPSATPLASPAPERMGSVPGAGTTPPGSAGGTDTAIPGSAGGTDTAPVSTRQPILVSRPIIIYQCIDANADRACNVNEGIAGVTAYVLNARTGEVLGQSVSNERGITQIYVSVLSDQELVVDVPFLGHNEAIRPTDTDAITMLNADVAAVPGLLP
jgi:hypothetical protein